MSGLERPAAIGGGSGGGRGGGSGVGSGGGDWASFLASFSKEINSQDQIEIMKYSFSFFKTKQKGDKSSSANRD